MTLYRKVDLLDGDGLRHGVDLEIREGQITGITPSAPQTGAPVICPGLVDLQVNGGGGWMLNDCQTPADLAQMIAAHRGLGTTALLPTLISDTAETTARVIDLVATAKKTTPAILGLHLEGPHLALAGAHDPTHLRPMTEADLALYLDAKDRLGHLLITLAPEQVDLRQIETLAKAGVRVSLGHSGCDYQTASAAFAAGACLATHLFNAMSGLHHRDPGLVGAALDHAQGFGVIADGHHVHDAALRVLLRARPEAVFLVSDAMAVAGTAATGFSLGGRAITRQDGRLCLTDGTLAGADLSLLQAARHLAQALDRPLIETLPYAFDAPMRHLTGLPNRLNLGDRADLLIVENGHVSLVEGEPLPL